MLLINDLINNVIERYQSFKRGDFSAQLVIDPSIDPSKGGADAVPTASITDLISFDDEEATSSNQPANTSSVLDDFASLSFDTPSAISANTNGNGIRNKTVTNSLPLDLFNTNNTSSNRLESMSGGAPLGQWGALQLPMSNAATPKNGSITPATTQSSSQNPLPPNGQASQTAADPFADLSKW